MNNKLGLFLKDSYNVGMRKGTVALLALHDALGLYFANTISGNEDQFKEILNRAHYFATQTQIDPDAFSDEYKPTLVKLLMLTKQAYNYFKIKEINRDMEINMLMRMTYLNIIGDFYF